MAGRKPPNQPGLWTLLLDKIGLAPQPKKGKKAGGKRKKAGGKPGGTQRLDAGDPALDALVSAPIPEAPEGASPFAQYSQESGLGFADAVSAVPAAVAAKRAIVLVDRSRTSAASLGFIEGRDVAALGGPAVDALAAAKVKVSASIVGTDRYQTAALIAARYLPGSKRAYLASGVSFPDGLTAGVLAARQSAPILLSPADALPAATTAALTAGAGSQRVYLVGGTGVLGNTLEPAIAAVP